MLKYRIVLIPFPFDDLHASKVRPAVCLCEPKGAFKHVIVAFISSRIPPVRLESDLLIDAGRPDFNVTGLKVASTIRLHRLMTVPVSAIVRELGCIPDDKVSEIRLKLNRLFELD
ncbi:MAG: type II toxin-antitoxin system PemK/MazF family toxin [Candidatus Coatesbacteria bacterium]|nr:type II toxin-antitoxin system PemK/MazF family toxin [Candidatus Coatesbacteria bacterium]